MSETTDLFEGQQAQPEPDLSEWIGEGKKYKTQEDALKSVPHAQKHIQNLEESYSSLQAELEALRAEAQKREGMEEVLKRLEQRESQATEPQAQESQGAQPSVDPASLVTKFKVHTTDKFPVRSGVGNPAVMSSRILHFDR